MKLSDEWKWLLLLAAVCALVYANSLTGTFVYDDLRQVLRNPLVQDNSMIWRALTSDVWAFKGDGSAAASNYWRPTFTAWHIINYRLFGANPVGWHVTNLLLHSSVCLLIFALLRRWAFSAATAFTIALIFCIHPVHVESVAWISGSPDLLFALAFLGSLWFASAYAETGKVNFFIVSAILYAVALGAKEIGILCLPIYYLAITASPVKPKEPVDAKMATLALGSLAVIYFMVRWSIIGAISRAPDDAVGFAGALLSIPSMFAFYLRQIFFPVWMGANYPLEPVGQIGFENFVLPLIVSIAAVGAVVYLAKTVDKGRLAAAIFLLPLLPAMNATAFIPEQIVHDRYLYLPLLGSLMLVVPFAAKLISERNVLIAGVLISAALGFQTVRYNRAWANDLALWSWTSTIDNSSFTAMQLGDELAEQQRYDEAVKAFSSSIAKRLTVRGYLGRGRVFAEMHKYADAERDLKSVFQFPPGAAEAYALYQAYEALGLTYAAQGNYAAALDCFTEARDRLPIYHAALSVDLAIVLYQAGKKDQAMQELENARVQARKEMLPESKAVFLRLGMLYAEAGRKDDARSNLREYLSLTKTYNDKVTLDERQQAGKMLDSMK